MPEEQSNQEIKIGQLVDNAPPQEVKDLSKPIEQPKAQDPAPLPIEMDASKSKEERIMAYLEKRKTGNFVRMGDFLKSLYPVSKPNEPQKWADQREMKNLKVLLRKLRDENKVFFASESFELLGKHYYHKDDGKTQYHNVTTLIIEGKIY